MKRTILFSLFIVAVAIGCDDDKKGTKEVDFYNTSHRIGLWISYKDTLNFIDDKNLIIQKDRAKDEFNYKIENEKLILMHKNSRYNTKTTHAIKVLDSNNVILGNMRATIEFQDSSVSYKKIKK